MELLKSKKLLILVGLAIFLMIVLIIALFLTRETDNGVTPLPFPTIGTPSGFIRPSNLPTLIPDDQVPTAPPTPIARPGTIIVSDIPVNNFLASSEQVNENGDALIASTNDYQLTYLAQFQEFNISITGANFEQVRSVAEQHLLTVLGIDEQNACWLSIQVTAPAYADHEYAGIVLPLSFCADEEF